MNSDRDSSSCRLASGGVFVAFGLGKFVNHASELASFTDVRAAGSELFVLAIGVVEVVEGCC